ESGLSHMTVRLAVDPGRSTATMLVGSYEDISWTIRRGSKLIIDVGPNQEVITVQSVAVGRASASGSFRARVTKQHVGDFPITSTFLGNPGPRPRFNPRDPLFSGLVRYLSIID